MNTTVRFFLLKFLWHISFVSCALSSKVNITKFENCRDLLQPEEIIPVELLSVEFQQNDGKFIDTVHGSYIVRSIDTREKELIITIYHCPEMGKTTEEICNKNPKRFVENLKCDRFNMDSTGPWYMISAAMSGSKCGEEKGKFSFRNATMKEEYLEKYITEGVDKYRGKYRMKLLFHKKSEAIDDIHVRCCIDMEFQIFA